VGLHNWISPFRITPHKRRCQFPKSPCLLPILSLRLIYWLYIFSQLTLDSLKAYNNFLATVYQSVQISIGDAKSALFRGDSDASNRDIIQWIKEGAFVTLADDTEAKISDYFYKTMTAGAINALWRANMVYIVGAPSDDCQHANNPSHDGYNSKVCIDGDNSAYYLYMLALALGTESIHIANKCRLGNHGRPFPQVLAPSGWDSLGQLGLSIQVQTHSN